MTTVVHCRNAAHRTTASYVYIGRPSKWGNPFIIGRDGTRAEVIEKYDLWIQTQPELLAALPELKDKVLGCWCKPRACHGDVLARLADAT
jgi:hypothetical protein